MTKLNGWMRLWVFMSVLWAAFYLFAMSYTSIVDALISVVTTSAVLFGVGYGIAWVRRGFKKTN